MNQYQIVVPLLQTGNGAGATMCGAIVDDPEDSSGLGVGGLAHHLGDKAIKGDYATSSLAMAEELGLVNIERGKVSPRAASFVFMLHLHGGVRLGRVGDMAAAPGLDTGFLIRRQNELVLLEGMSVPYPFIQIQDSTRFGGKLGVTREDPRPILPGSNGILMEPAPQRRIAEIGHKTVLPNLSVEVGNTPPREGHSMRRWQFTSQRLDLNDQLWGEKPEDGPGGEVLRDLGDVVQRTVFATC